LFQPPESLTLPKRIITLSKFHSLAYPLQSLHRQAAVFTFGAEPDYHLASFVVNGPHTANVGTSFIIVLVTNAYSIDPKV
jgi:hypothetical protein